MNSRINKDIIKDWINEAIEYNHRYGKNAYLLFLDMVWSEKFLMAEYKTKHNKKAMCKKHNALNKLLAEYKLV